LLLHLLRTVFRSSFRLILASLRAIEEDGEAKNGAVKEKVSYLAFGDRQNLAPKVALQKINVHSASLTYYILCGPPKFPKRESARGSNICAEYYIYVCDCVCVYQLLLQAKSGKL
jgi:hypothetical protein